MEQLNSWESVHKFDLDVPYQVVSSDKNHKKPLIIYLHGFNQNIRLFRTKTELLQQLDAHHLFIQGPYPIYDRRRKKRVEEWGRAWYLYDGEQDQFKKSLEKTSIFIDGIIEDITSQCTVSRVAMLGYSMGGYLAGYYALSRVNRITELVVIGSRIKTELFSKKNNRYDQLKVLALHGSNDTTVKSYPQKRSTEELSNWGADVTFTELDATHSLSTLFLQETKQWFLSKENYLGLS